MRSCGTRGFVAAAGKRALHGSVTTSNLLRCRSALLSSSGRSGFPSLLRSTSVVQARRAAHAQPEAHARSAAAAVHAEDGRVEVQWRDGRTSPFHHTWLRHNCQCPKCLDSSSGQKLVSILDFPPRPVPRSVSLENGQVVVRWKDGHVSPFPQDFLRRYAYDQQSRHERRAMRRAAVPWTPEVLISESVALEIDYADLMNKDEAVWQWLQQLLKFGYCLIRGVPQQEGEVARVAQRMGQLRDTIYGLTWDVKSIENAANIAYSSLPIPPHMDLMYYEVPPGYQFLHCLINQAEGGANIFLDTMQVAKVLKERDEKAFRLLATTPATFHYQRSGHHLVQRRPIIELDQETGDASAFRYAPTFEGPLDIEGEKVEEYYAAYRELVRIINQEPDLHLWRRPEEGDLVSFDNRRILHARTAFSNGNRHLQGAYVDWDAFLDRYRVLQSQFAPTAAIPQ